MSVERTAAVRGSFPDELDVAEPGSTHVGHVKLRARDWPKRIANLNFKRVVWLTSTSDLLQIDQSPRVRLRLTSMSPPIAGGDS